MEKHHTNWLSGHLKDTMYKQNKKKKKNNNKKHLKALQSIMAASSSWHSYMYRTYNYINYLVLGSNKYDCQSQWRKRDGAHQKKYGIHQFSGRSFMDCMTITTKTLTLKLNGFCKNWNQPSTGQK